jgi:hypothetical protein
LRFTLPIQYKGEQALNHSQKYDENSGPKSAYLCF